MGRGHPAVEDDLGDPPADRRQREHRREDPAARLRRVVSGTFFENLLVLATFAEFWRARSRLYRSRLLQVNVLILHLSILLFQTKSEKTWAHQKKVILATV